MPKYQNDQDKDSHRIRFPKGGTDIRYLIGGRYVSEAEAYGMILDAVEATGSLNPRRIREALKA